MAIATAALKQTLNLKIKQILDTPFDENTSSDKIKTDFAKALSDAIGDALDVWIKTGQVTVAAGIPVATAGSPTAQTGATTGPGTGTIA